MTGLLTFRVLPENRATGWPDAETTAFQAARDGFGPAEQYRVKSISGAKDTATQKNADAATLYENILTIQNAADLEWPATDPGQRLACAVNFWSHFPARPRRQPCPAAHATRAANIANKIIMKAPTSVHLFKVMFFLGKFKIGLYSDAAHTTIAK